MFLLFCAQCSATTGVFVITPDRIVAGIDRMVNQPASGGTLVNVGTAEKIVLLRGRFIVACIGLESMQTGPSPTQQVLTYNFPTWIRAMESQIGPDSSVPMLADIIERESARIFTTTVPIGDMMKAGTLKHIEAMDKYLVQFEVAGFDRGVASLIEISYELDWQNEALIGPKAQVHLPSDKISVALYNCGRYDSIGTDKLTDFNSYAHKRMSVLAPTAFKKILASKPTSQSEAIRAVRAFITVESEVEPHDVGSGSTVVVLPVVGNGTVTEYQRSVALGKTRAAGKEGKREVI
jgi:hypothetical protein